MAEHAHNTTTLNRRGLASAGAALLALAGGGAVAKAAMPNPDAALIQACAEHIVNLNTYNRDGGYLECEDDPLWAAYVRTRDAVACAEPQTLEGMTAKAHAAKAEAQCPGGVECPGNGPAARWAWHLVNDLLRMTGRA